MYNTFLYNLFFVIKYYMKTEQIIQIIIVVILIIITIIITLWLISQVENPVPQVILPFNNGAFIKIKSLANNKYLRPVGGGCTSGSSYGSCQSPFFAGCGSSQYIPGPITQLVADGDENDSNTVWQLCQYTGTKPTPNNNAVYSLYHINQASGQVVYQVSTSSVQVEPPNPLYGPFGSDLFTGYSGVLGVRSSSIGCPGQAEGTLCGCSNIQDNYERFNTNLDFAIYFCFQLIENDNPIAGLSSSVYNISSGEFYPNGFFYWHCLGTRVPGTFSGNCTCPDIVGYKLNPSPGSIQTEAINYGFSIEVVSG